MKSRDRKKTSDSGLNIEVLENLITISSKIFDTSNRPEK